MGHFNGGCQCGAVRYECNTIRFSWVIAIAAIANERQGEPITGDGCAGRNIKSQRRGHVLYIHRQNPKESNLELVKKPTKGQIWS